ncbi:MAG TPA: C40 family peptidase [Archangium sp.]|nr:C40 family peptidase [Archangium sp.]
MRTSLTSRSLTFLFATCATLALGCGQGVEETPAPAPEQAATEEAGQVSSELTASRAEVMDFARTWLGTPYSRNTCSREGVDCSCFTKKVFGHFGKTLPDDPVLQWNYGRRIDRSELRNGDLVFFKEGGSNVITHVGIYSGNGEIIHASTYFGRVVEKEMRYVDGFFGARTLF